MNEEKGRKVYEGKGENGPQSPSALFDFETRDRLALSKFKQIFGNDMGHVNMTDISRLIRTIVQAAANFEKNFSHSYPYLAFGVKHGNCCGGAFDQDKVRAIKKMLRGDPQAIFGGFVMVDFDIDGECAETLLRFDRTDKRRKLDGIVAPGFNEEAVNILKNKSGSCRLFVNPALEKIGIESFDYSPIQVPVRGGMLVQSNYHFALDLTSDNHSLACYGQINNEERADLLLADAVCRTSNSNTITIVKDGMLIGNGIGQQSRVRAAKVALLNVSECGHSAEGAAAASDSFFPFPDGVEVLIDAGVKAIFSTSGSQNDQKTIDLCKERNVRLLMMPDSIARGFCCHMG